MAGRFPILYIAEADASDAILSSGVLAYMVEAMPQASFTVVGSPKSAPLFADTPRLDRLIVLERDSRLDWLGLWNKVRETRWGLVVDMRGTTLSAKLKRQKRAVRGAGRPGSTRSSRRRGCCSSRIFRARNCSLRTRPAKGRTP